MQQQTATRLCLAGLLCVITTLSGFASAQEPTTVTVPIQLRGFERAEIFSRLEGYVADVLVDIGDQLTENQPMIRLRIPEIQAEQLRRQKLVTKAEADLQSQEAEVAATRAKLDAHQAVERLRGKELQRTKNLVQSGALRQEKLDESEHAYESVKAQLKSMEAEVVAAEAQLYGARAAIDVAKAELHKAETMAEYLVLRAPFDGEIMQRSIDTGDLVRSPTANDKPLLILVRTDRLRGVMMVMADHANAIHASQEVEIKGIRGLQDQVVQAAVSRFARSLDEGTRMMRVEVDLENPEDEHGIRRLKPGDYGRAYIAIPSNH